MRFALCKEQTVQAKRNAFCKIMVYFSVAPPTLVGWADCMKISQKWPFPFRSLVQVLCWLVSVSCCSFDLAPQIALHWPRSAASSRHLEKSVGRELLYAPGPLVSLSLGACAVGRGQGTPLDRKDRQFTDLTPESAQVKKWVLDIK